MKMQMIKRGDGTLTVFGRNEAMKKILGKAGYPPDAFLHTAPCWARSRLSEFEKMMLLLLKETDGRTANVGFPSLGIDRPKLPHMTRAQAGGRRGTER
jgi:hypothetical protein